jgi:hypothetical protein
MRKPVRNERMKALVVQQRLQIAIAGWIAIKYRSEVCTENLTKMLARREYALKSLIEEHGINVSVLYPLS